MQAWRLIKNYPLQRVSWPGSDKDTSNLNKHGVSLALGGEVLADENRLEVKYWMRFDYGEDRFVTYGMVEGGIWVCVFTPRGETCRIISVRKVNDREAQRYHKTPR